MYTTIFEFETKEEASELIKLISSTLLEWNAKDNKVFIHEELEEDAEFNKDTYLNILEEKEIYVTCKIEDNTEKESLTEYESGERFY
ncbi:MAG: hypothetical protein [Caudoviricetes sp.]|nr:MAG: hypothetical protein [Caudoviricetes sp.]